MMLVQFFVLATFVFLGTAAAVLIVNWLWPDYICHACQDEKHKISHVEYLLCGGQHWRCP